MTGHRGLDFGVVGALCLDAGGLQCCTARPHCPCMWAQLRQKFGVTSHFNPIFGGSASGPLSFVTMRLIQRVRSLVSKQVNGRRPPQSSGRAAIAIFTA